MHTVDPEAIRVRVQSWIPDSRSKRADSPSGPDLCGEPRGRDFLLARIAQRIGGGVESKKGSRVCDTLANFFGDGCLIRDVPFVAPDADSSLSESIQERLRSPKIMSPIAKENIMGHCQSPPELSSLEP
jgi:hypothetical protein